MSIASLEKAMWDIGASPVNLSRFKDSPDQYLSGYPLSDREKIWLKGMDVRAMTDGGCDPMLAMMTWNAVMGGDQTPEYMRRMNTPSV